MSKPENKALDACKEYLRRYDAMKLDKKDSGIAKIIRDAVQWHKEHDSE